MSGFRARDLLPVAAVALYLLATALTTTASAYGVRDLAVVALAYVLLAVVLVGGSLFARSLGSLPAAVGALAVAAVLVWHWREQNRLFGGPTSLWQPLPLLGFLALVALTALGYAALERLSIRTPRRLVHGGAALASAVVLTALVSLSFHATHTLRWHLLRHNQLLGVPSYHLLAPDVAELRDELLHRGGRATGPAEEKGDPTAGSSGAARDDPALAGADPAGAAPEAESAGAPGPHVLFVLVDTLRADGLEAYGGRPDLMPAMNRFARHSHVFGDVYANSSWTIPSVASFFTGLLPEEHGVPSWGYLLPDHRRTLAERLSSAGYRTAAFTANRVVDPAAGFAQGFDHFTVVDSGDEPYPRAREVNRVVRRWLASLEAPVGGNGVGAPGGDRAADGASATVAPANPARRGGSRPLFLYVHYMDPHTPYLSGGPRRPDDDEAAVEAYGRELRYLDGALEELLDLIRRRLAGRTIVFLTSDHGEELGEHGARGHGHTLYDEVVEIPALVRFLDADDAAGGRRGSGRRDRPPDASFLAEPLEGRDFFELLLDLARKPDLDVPAWARRHRRQRRYVSLYNRKDASATTRLLRPYRSVICMRRLDEGDHSLIWSAYGPTLELYDRRADPGQLVNLADTRPRIVGELVEAMGSAVERWVEPVPTRLDEADLEALRGLGYVR